MVTAQRLAQPSACAQPVHALQRSSGAVRLAFDRRGSQTCLRELYQSGSGKARVMRLANGGFREVVLVNTSGGMTDGDRFRQSVRWGDGARGVVTTQAAERIYRARAGAAELVTRLSVGAGGRAVWAPQETILFDGGRFRRNTDVDVAETGELIACEALVYSRAAMGERVRRGLVDDRWRVRVAGRLVYADGLRLEGDIAGALERPAVAMGAAASATLLYVGARAAEMRDQVRLALEGVEASWGCTARLGVTVVRCAAKTALALRTAVEAAMEALMAALAPAGPSLPRSWRI